MQAYSAAPSAAFRSLTVSASDQKPQTETLQSCSSVRTGPVNATGSNGKQRITEEEKTKTKPEPKKGQWKAIDGLR